MANCVQMAQFAGTGPSWSLQTRPVDGEDMTFGRRESGRLLRLPHAAAKHLVDVPPVADRDDENLEYLVLRLVHDPVVSLPEPQ